MAKLSALGLIGLKSVYVQEHKGLTISVWIFQKATDDPINEFTDLIRAVSRMASAHNCPCFALRISEATNEWIVSPINSSAKNTLPKRAPFSQDALKRFLDRLQLRRVAK